MREALLVTDVDNTIFDWVGTWARGVTAMLDVLERDTGRTREYWLAALRNINIRRHTLECQAALHDLSQDAAWDSLPDRSAILTRTAAAYRRAWDAHLTAYDGLRDALARLVEHGWAIAAYTESDAVVAATRLTRLGLASVVPRVFGRAPFSIPPVREWALVDTPPRLPIAISFIPREETKPNPTGLRDIAVRSGTPLSQVVYLGDNLWKDVVMAQRLGVPALWAAYGATRQPQDTALVNRLRHWTPDDVADEQRASTTALVAPDQTLHTASELFNAAMATATAVGC